MKIKNIIVVIFLLCLATVAISQQTKDLINEIDNRLSKRETTVSQILCDTSLITLHSLTPFREMIRQHAKPGFLKMVASNEPGTMIKVTGTVSDKLGKEVAGKLVYVYQTSAEGWYSDTAPHILKNEGDRNHARLFAYFKTGINGKFEFVTIKPKGYPNSSLPAHIHIEISLTDGGSFISELLFDDDPRLVGDIRTRSIKENFFIVKNSGTAHDPLYEYKIKIPY